MSWNTSVTKYVYFLQNEGFGSIKIPDVFLMPPKIKFVFTMKINENYCTIPKFGNINIILTKTLLYAKNRPDKKNEKTQTMIKELEKQINNSKNTNEIQIKTELIAKLKLSDNDDNYISSDSLMSIAFKIHNTMFESYKNAEIIYNIFVNLLIPKPTYEPSNIKEFKFKQDDSWKKQPLKQDIITKKYDTKYVPNFETKESVKQTNKYVIPTEKKQQEKNINISINDGFINLSEIIIEKPINIVASTYKDLKKSNEEEERKKEEKEKYLSSLSLAKYLEYRIAHPEEFPLKIIFSFDKSLNKKKYELNDDEEYFGYENWMMNDYYINNPRYSFKSDEESSYDDYDEDENN
jgi:hypothetical protein